MRNYRVNRYGHVRQQNVFQHDGDIEQGSGGMGLICWGDGVGVVLLVVVVVEGLLSDLSNYLFWGDSLCLIRCRPAAQVLIGPAQVINKHPASCTQTSMNLFLQPCLLAVV